jgi:hypothetical protein
MFDFEQYKPLFLKANRALGTALVEDKLVTAEHLDLANARLLDMLRQGEFKQASLLNILLANPDVLKEGVLVQYQIDAHELSLINFTSYNLERSVSPETDFAACWATRTLPYDVQEEFVFLATNFYLSEPVRAFWQDIYQGKQLVWSIAGVADLGDALERVESRIGGSSIEPKTK